MNTLKERDCPVSNSSPDYHESWGLKSFENLNKTDVVFYSSENKDLAVTSWMDWWFYSFKSLAIKRVR